MPTSVRDPAACQFCDASGGLTRAVRARVQAWWCAKCGTGFASAGLTPFLDRLAREVAERSLLHQVDTLVAEAPRLTDGALRARLITMLVKLDRHARKLPE